ncbi:MAG TPA: hypothetical protein VJH24_05420 [Candidatus Bilamarchaeaceae archaeon]|nr:hypothetical protein [Candidatus Bilamarchaeaceae archaeon]
MFNGCKKCGIPLISVNSCIEVPEFSKLAKMKKINYEFGEPLEHPITSKCVKCNNEFEVSPAKLTPSCPKCHLLIIDNGCAMIDDLANMEKNKQINFICGKTAPEIQITCVGCGLKFFYNRNTNRVVK